ncbi:ATP6V1D [Symbiodinium sp. CCMP2592]|nr:ATP6V1D [Symbiodinium sp. CCMP2592]
MSCIGGCHTIFSHWGGGWTKTFARAWRQHASSSFTGVSWNSKNKKFQATVSFQGISYYAGCFNFEVAYDNLLRQLCPKGARLKKSLNFPSLSEANFEESLQDARARALAGAATSAKEEESFIRLHDRFSATPLALTHEIIRVSGSSRVDALLQRKGCDEGLPLQLKAASMSGNLRRSYYFSRASGYCGMLLLLISLDRDIMWAIPGSVVAKPTITIRLDSEADEAYRVIDLGSTLEQHFLDQEAIAHISLKHARLWCSQSHRVEEYAHLQMADLFARVGFQLEKAHTLTAVDSVLVAEGCRWLVQEKASSRQKPRGDFCVSLRKGKSYQAYSDSDFDLLLAAVLEDNKLLGVFLIPVQVLHKHGLVGGKPRKLLLWPPWKLPVLEARRVKTAWQLECFVDLRGWSQSEAVLEKASNRLVQLLRFVQTSPASESTKLSSLVAWQLLPGDTYTCTKTHHALSRSRPEV